MNRPLLMTSTVLSGALVLGLMGSAVRAADPDMGAMPAVSAINGKIEIGGGFSDFDGSSTDEILYGAASLSVPLGDMFGLQGDLGVTHMFGETGVGGNVHLFTRDPNAYLLGAIAGYADVGPANAYWFGGEAEVYMDNMTLELAAGYLNVNPNIGSSSDELFAIADLAFYPVENLRVSLGGSSIAGFESGNIAAEYMLDSMPMSLKFKGEVGEDKFVAATAGISFYFGGNDSTKSLMRRHREDDPRNRVLDIFGAGAAAFGGGTPAAGPGPAPDPECSTGQIRNPESGLCETVIIDPEVFFRSELR